MFNFFNILAHRLHGSTGSTLPPRPTLQIIMVDIPGPILCIRAISACTPPPSLLNLGLDKPSEKAKVIEDHSTANNDVVYDDLILELSASIDDLLKYKV